MEKSVGQILKETREKRKIKLEDVYKKIRTSRKYLLALEEDRPNEFPGEVYFLGFLRTYAKFLGLNPEELVQKYQQSITQIPTESIESVKRPKFLVILQQYRMVILLGLFVIVFIYFLSSKLRFEKKEKVRPPTVPVVTSQEKKLILEAKASKDSWLRVIADGNLLYERILSSGTEKRWEAKEKFHLRVGYVPGVEMKLNGRPVDLIAGSSGYIKEFDLP